MTDSIFNSYSTTSKKSTIDIYASKIDLIFKDLKAQDSLTKLRAQGAFGYYEFEKGDLPKLYEHLETNFGNDSINEFVKFNIIEIFNTISDDETLEHLRKLYFRSSLNDKLKTEILATIQNLGNEKNIDVYTDLLLNHPPTDLNSKQWFVFRSFRDSSALAISNYDKLISLMDKEDYRQSILSITNDILDMKQDSLNIVKENFDRLLKFSQEDLNNYLIVANDSTNMDYSYNGRIHQYLRLMEHPEINSDHIDGFSNKILNNDNNPWYKTRATALRINHKLPIEQKLVNKLMDSLYSRYDIMKAYHNIGEFRKVPKSYQISKSFAKLSLSNFLDENDDYGYNINILDEYEQNGNTYLGAKISYTYNETIEDYFALIGPIYDLSEKKDLKLYEIHLNWNDFSENWIPLAEALLKETENQD